MRPFGAYVVECLAANGVDHVFGIPGVHTVELYRALPGSPIRHITPRHEQGAGFMAEGYARVTGKPGVCFVITGPGLTNIATAMAQAYGESLPMLVISTVNPVGAMGSGAGHLHELPDQRQLMRQFTAFSHTILDIAEFDTVLARAFAVFSASRPRPVHIEIPVDLLVRDSSGLGAARAISPIAPPGPNAAAVSEAVEACARASRPLIVAGGGSKAAAGAIARLAGLLDAPVLMTTNGRGVLSDADPLAVPLNPGYDAAHRLLAHADLVIAVGTELGPTDFDDTLPAVKSMRPKVIRIDLDPEQICRGLPADIGIISDARLAVEALCDGARQREAGQGAERVRATLGDFETGLSARTRAGLHLLNTLRDTLPDVIIVGDSTQPVYSGCLGFAASTPSSFFCSATGYGTLGYALPAAIGAKLGNPSRPVVCITGDGGIQFTLAELGSAVEADARLIVILWNNQGYGEIKSYMQGRDIEPLGVDIFTPDFRKIAEAFGWRWDKAARPEVLRQCLSMACAHQGSTVLEIDEAAFLEAFPA
ncbi:5-guanidino-2-oxopentanoate decarboxylase [Mesorhizobium sp. ES1-1]|uniref:5-guanidino-2-oxopentanoate decarboxylase n=1 Tax=Mesorhizobium sp. ES1-1 TaxID=2876629 RepID=UPI001CCAF47F|nr:5-guanidino-2-oxopentanoate decarboxylase [Mesorhizobium sp. ES1-1]MBZ9675432.1 5-guanidino-2-oxopentanoate decarboxylase [Mesorhizobium sp. ES1-1]